MGLPVLIQGGMGVAISDWYLARTVSKLGQLGVVSGTGIRRILVIRLVDGDLAGRVRRALDSTPMKETTQTILDRYFVPGGKAKNGPYKNPPPYTVRPSRFLDQLTAIASYGEVFLAKEGHGGIVGMNLPEKCSYRTSRRSMGRCSRMLTLSSWVPESRRKSRPSWIDSVTTSRILPASTFGTPAPRKTSESRSTRKAPSLGFQRLPGSSSDLVSSPSFLPWRWHRLWSNEAKELATVLSSRARPRVVTTPRRGASSI